MPAQLGPYSVIFPASQACPFDVAGPMDSSHCDHCPISQAGRAGLILAHTHFNISPSPFPFFTSSRNLAASIPVNSKTHHALLERWSERQDLNLRRLGPKPSALAKLSYAPTRPRPIIAASTA
jgi:hypothetical protein